MKVKLTKLKCTRCGHQWFPKLERLPVRCPNSKTCGSPYWNTPIKKK